MEINRLPFVKKKKKKISLSERGGNYKYQLVIITSLREVSKISSCNISLGELQISLITFYHKDFFFLLIA